MSQTRGLVLKIDASSAPKAARDLGVADSAMARFTRTAGSLAGGGARVAAGATLALAGAATAAAAAMAKFASDSLTQERVFARLAGSLGRAGIAYEDARGRIAEFAAEQQRTTRFGDDATAASIRQLTDLTSGLGASTEHLIAWQRLAADVAEATGQSLESATQAVGKAAAGNVEALNELIPAQRDAVREMGKITDAGERGAAAIDLLSGTFEGAAQAIHPLDLAVSRLTNGLGDVREGLGSIVTENAAVQESMARVADLTDIVAAAFNAGTPIGQAWGETIGSSAEWAASRVIMLTSAAIQATQTMQEVARLAAGGSDNAAQRRQQETGAALNAMRDAAAESGGNFRRLAASLDAATEAGALTAEAAANVRREFDAASQSRNVDERITRRENGMRLLASAIDDVARAETAAGQAVGANNTAFVDRQQQVAALRDQLAALARGERPEVAAPQEQAALSRLTLRAEQSAAAVAEVERNTVEQERRFRIETNDRMAALFDSHAETMRAKKEAVSAQTVEAQQALDAKLFVLEDERQRRLQIAADKEAATLAQRQQIGVSAANRLTAAIGVIELKSARERRAALRKMAGEELVTEGAKLVAQGAGNLIALNPIGGLQVAGGLFMIGAGAKLGASGGGGGGGGSSASGRAPAAIERGPERASGPVDRSTTVIVNMGGSLPRRAIEDAQRSSVIFSGAA